jgi:peptidyl-prolyl cis-trans isomerase B (cyclophilin B)
MAKRRKQTPQRTHVYQSGQVRPGFSRRQPAKPAQSGPSRTWLALGAVAVVLVLAGLAYAGGFFGGLGPSASSPVGVGTIRPSFNVQPPAATPLASPPAEPAGDGTTATIDTELGSITFEIFNQSAPVASENFTNLAEAGFYDGVVFHRIVPGFMIQGGDPQGTGRGGPGYTIQDEPIVGTYTRGMVAMARSDAPNSQGSQFFIIVGDSPFLAGGGYTIFGRVTTGMEVADQIVSMPSANNEPGGRGGTALDPVVMESVTIQRPGEAL